MTERKQKEKEEKGLIDVILLEVTRRKGLIDVILLEVTRRKGAKSLTRGKAHDHLICSVRFTALNGMYVRIRPKPRIRIHGEYGSPEFMTAYRNAINGVENPVASSVTEMAH